MGSGKTLSMSSKRVSRRDGRRALRPIACLVAALPLFVALGSSAVAQEATGIPVTLRVVPGVEDVVFSLGDQKLRTDADGIAFGSVSVPGTYALRVKSHHIVQSGQRIDLAAWSDGEVGREREVTISAALDLSAGFDTSYLVRQDFVDADGQRVAAQDIESITVTDDAGEALTLPGSTNGLSGPTAPVWQRYPAGSRWLPGARIRLSDAGLTEESITYEPDHVVTGGKEVPVSSEPFDPSSTEVWSIRVAGYQVRLGAKDVLLGSGSASEIALTSPGGETIDRVAPRGDTVLLPAGSYVATARGGGIPLNTRFSVPGTSTVQASVLGYVDIVLGGALVGLVAVPLVLRRSRRRSETGAAPARKSVDVPTRSGEAKHGPVAGNGALAPIPSASIPPAPPPEKRRVRVHLHSGRSIEGWTESSPDSSREVVIMTVALVRDPDGQVVAGTPLDSFLLSSQIARIEPVEEEMPTTTTASAAPSAQS